MQVDDVSLHPLSLTFVRVFDLNCELNYYKFKL